MKIKSVLIILIAQFLFLHSWAQIKVYPVANANTLNAKDGLFYFLPRTVLKIDVIAELEEDIPGPLHAYAEKYMGLAEVIETPSKHYKIKEIRIGTISQPDPEQSYFVHVDRKSKEDKSLFLRLTKSGIIKGVNFMDNAGELEYQQIKVNLDSNKEKSLFNYFADQNFYQHMDTIVRRISVDTVSYERYFYNTSWLKKDLEQKAREASDYLAKIRENRFLLLTGYQETNYAGSMQYMDGQLKRMESEYLSLFTGRTRKELLFKSYVYIPSKNASGNQMVFRFSEAEGFMVKNSSQGSAVTLKLIPEQNSFAADRFVQKSNDIIDGELSGYYYRIPEQVNIQVLYNGEIIHESSKIINQFGIVAQTPSVKAEIEFDTETGMVKSIRLR